MAFYFEDPLAASELFQELAERLDDLGYPQLVDIVYGVTPTADALENADSPGKAMLLAKLLKSMRAEMQYATQKNKYDPAPARALQVITQAMQKFEASVTRASDGGYHDVDGEVVEW